MIEALKVPLPKEAKIWYMKLAMKGIVRGEKIPRPRG
jgi:hypothetical protein